MMGENRTQSSFYYNISLESFVPEDHPLRRIRPLIKDQEIRRQCAHLYSSIGRPSIPPEQLFLALIGGYLLGIRSERRLVMELQCNMALRWFVGLQIDQNAWNASTFSKNRRRRFDEAGILEKLFDHTVRRAIDEGLVSRHVSDDGTLVRANASYKSFAPIELAMEPDEYKRRIRADDKESNDDDSDDPGNRSVNYRGEKRSNKTHRSLTDPDSRLVSKGSLGGAAIPGYTVNAVMENRNRILLGIDAGIGHGSRVEEEGCLSLLDRLQWQYQPKSLGADKGYFHQVFINGLLERGIEPHVSPTKVGKQMAHRRVRQRVRGQAYKWSQRCRKKIEELFGEGKVWHGLRRFRRRGLARVREEVHLIGVVLNLKRMAKLLVECQPPAT